MFLLDVPKCKSIPEITCQNEVELYFFSFFPFWLSWRFLMAAKKKWPPKKMAAKKKWPPKKNGRQKYDQMMYLYVLIILMKLQTYYINNTKVIFIFYMLLRQQCSIFKCNGYQLINKSQ